MRTAVTTPALVALAAGLALGAAAAPLAADPAPLPSECARFAAGAEVPAHLDRRLARLCTRLVAANDSADGLTALEIEAATRLGQYLAVLDELELRAIREDGKVTLRPVRRTSDAGRYLIARRLGLLAIADRLAPEA